jgi:hypothetical protein
VSTSRSLVEGQSQGAIKGVDLVNVASRWIFRGDNAGGRLLRGVRIDLS